MSTTKKSTEQVPFLERPIVRTILPIAGFVIICVLFAFLTDGRLFQPKNISLLLSQSYMLLISSIGVFMVMTMGGLDFSQGSMLGVASIVVCYLSHYNMVLAAIGGVVTGGLIGLINGYFNVKRKITSFIVTICTMYLFRGVCAYALPFKESESDFKGRLLSLLTAELLRELSNILILQAVVPWM